MPALVAAEVEADTVAGVLGGMAVDAGVTGGASQAGEALLQAHLLRRLR